VDKTTAEQFEVQQFETDPRQELGFRKFSVKIPWFRNSSQSFKIKLFSQQDIVDKTTAQKPKVQQLQDPQAAAAAETSCRYYYSSDGKAELQDVQVWGKGS
jgi:hypothetical protein